MHSPGPFKLDDSRLSVHAIIDANGQDVAYLEIKPCFCDGEPCGSVTSRGRTAEELRDTARLFAAAADLLAACEAAMADGFLAGEAFALADAAIAKATTP